MNVGTELRSIIVLTQLYARVKPDIVHHATIKPVIYGSLAARFSRVPAVVNTITGLGYLFTSNDVRAFFLRQLTYPLFRCGFRHPNHRIIFQNRDDQEMFTSLTRETDTVLIPGSGVDIEKFTPSPEKSDDLVVVFPGRLLGDKGIREFVSAARQLHSEGVRARFVLVGDEDPGNPSAISRSELMQWIESGSVEWWGPCENMAEVYRCANLVVLPSYREGIPKVLLEAAASSRPVVTTDVPGCRDAVRNHETGFLVPPRDSEALAARIRDLLADRALRVRMGTTGRQFAVERFAIHHIIRAINNVYEQLADRS